MGSERQRDGRRIWDEVIRNTWKTGRDWPSRRGVNNLGHYIGKEGRRGNCLLNLWTGVMDGIGDTVSLDWGGSQTFRAQAQCVGVHS